MINKLNNIFKENDTLILDAKKSKKLPNLFWALLLSILILISGQIIGSIIMVFIYTTLSSIFNISPIQDFIFLFLQLFSFVFISIFVFIRVSFFEKRKISSIGFTKGNIIKKYFKGFSIGLFMMGLVVLLLYIFGHISIEKNPTQPTGISALGFVLVILIPWIIQGATEEILTRGWLMNLLGAKYNMWVGLITSSLFFSILHLTNPGVNFVSLINIALVGVFFGLYVTRTGNLWGACAIHSAWNFMQGNIFGLEVSGINVKVGSLVDLKLIGNPLVTGGTFGPEAGLCATFVLFLGILLLIYLPTNKLSNN